MPVKIPKGHEEPLRQLAAMDAAKRARLIETIRSGSAVLDPKDLIARVESGTGLEGKSVGAIVWMLISMYRACEGSKVDFGKDVADVAKGLLPEAEAQRVDWAAFHGDLLAILGCDESLGITAKVLDVRLEYGNVFCSARILTDIRPVFGSDPTRTPLAAAIVHNLHITHHAGESHEEFYVALDAEDLRKLRDHIDRAIKKEASLKSAIKLTPIKYLEAEVG